MSKRITQLTELTAPAQDDLLPIVDTSTGLTKKITYKNMVNIPELGWSAAGETWVYASSTTFTVAGVDVTDKYPVGTKIRLKQGGSYKYFYIIARTFSTNTTITVAAGSDYSLANATITDNYFSYAEVATGFPRYFSFTPSWTNFTVSTGGNARSEGKFYLMGNLCYFNVRAVLGTSGPSVGAGVTFVPPVPIDTNAYFTSGAGMVASVGHATILDSGVGEYHGHARIAGNVNSIDIACWLVNGTFAVINTISGTNPFTWGPGDALHVTGEYQIA